MTGAGDDLKMDKTSCISHELLEPGAVLQVCGISNHYRRRGGAASQVLSDVSLTMREGEAFGVVGESGCGKSTLCNAILGLIDYEGEIWACGCLLRKGKADKAQRRQIQAVFQDPQGALNPKKRIGWIMEEPLKIHKMGSKSERGAKVDEILEMIGLGSSYKSRYPGELSGGQRQRVCIGCALMLSPKLIVADEPVSALDVSAGAQVLNLLADLHKRLGLSILFISHNLNVVHYLCDRIAVMREGRIVELGSARDVCQSPKHPCTKALLAAIPAMDDRAARHEAGASCVSAPELIEMEGETKKLEPNGKIGDPHDFGGRFSGMAGAL